MTETVSGATARKGKAAAQAGRNRLTMERIHTTPGVHPYDQVTWERRDVVMTNWRDGSVNFEEHGYFATDEDAEIFGHELRYALVHQIFSFNSPVWFNVGTASPQQVSACFILSVDD